MKMEKTFFPSYTEPAPNCSPIIFSDGLGSLFQWIRQAPLLADVVHDAHDAEGFVHRHKGAFRLALSQTAADFLDLVVETVAFEMRVQPTKSRGISARSHPSNKLTLRLPIPL